MAEVIQRDAELDTLRDAGYFEDDELDPEEEAYLNQLRDRLNDELAAQRKRAIVGRRFGTPVYVDEIEDDCPF